MVNKLTYGGIQITFGIQASTPVVIAPRKNLLLVGPCYYIVDVFETDGSFSSDALLTGPASLIAGTAMANPGGRTGSVWVNGVETAIAFAAGTWSIGQVVSKLNEDVDGLEMFINNSTYLGAKTTRTGATASLKFTGTVAAYLGFTAGETAYGYGSYTEQGIEVPFSTLPDPREILDECVLDETSIDVYANVAGTQFHFSEDTAFERNGFYHPVARMLYSGGSPSGVGNSSPFAWSATTLYPWDPSAGFVNKFWAPGEDAIGYIPADPTDDTNVIKLQAYGARDGVDGAFKTSNIGDYHGTAGNGLYVVVTVGPGADGTVVTAAGSAVNIAITGTQTLNDVIAAIEAHAVASKMIYVDLLDGATGTTALADWDGTQRLYLGGGIAPLQFAGANSVTEPGGEFSVRGDRITGFSMVAGDYLDIGVEGGIRTRIVFEAGDDLTAIVAAINDAFADFDIASKAAPGTSALLLTGPTTATTDLLGFKSSLAIYGSNCIPRLFIKDTQLAIATIAGTTTTCVAVAAAGVTGGVTEGDTIRLNGGTATATISKIYSTGGNYYMYLTEPTTAFLPELYEGPDYVDIDIISQLTVSNFTSHRHHGKGYMVKSNDRLWGQGTVKTTLLSANNTISTTGEVTGAQQTFTYAALETGDLYGVTQTFPYWYIESRGCEDSTGALKPYPSLLIDQTNNYLTIYNDAIVDSYGRSQVNPSYTLYAGYTALRQDLSPLHSLDRTKISGPADLLDKLDPISPLENPLGYGAYLAMLASGGLYDLYVLGVPSDDVAGYLQCVPIMKKYPDWCIVPLTSNSIVSQVFGSFVSTMMAPDMRREVVTLLTADIPEEEYATTLGSGAGCATNETGAETLITLDAGIFSITAVLTAGGIDPETLTSDDGVYLQISGGGASEEEGLQRYLISSVDSDQNTATVKIIFTTGENDDAYYSEETPPVVTEADINIYVRGEAIDDDDTDTKLESLQALSDTFSNRRVCLLPSDGFDVDHNGVTTKVPNYYGAAALGGYLLAHRVEFPLSGYTIPGLLHAYGTDDTFTDLDRITGLLFLQNGVAANTVETCRQFTTDTSDTKMHEFSITSQLDSLALRVRDALRGWRKKNVGDETMSEQNLQVSAACEACMVAREIKSAKIKDIAMHPTLINVHNIIIESDTFIPMGGTFVYIIA